MKQPKSKGNFKKKVVTGALALVTALTPAHDTKRILPHSELPESVKTIPDNYAKELTAEPTHGVMGNGLLMQHQIDAIKLSHQYKIFVVEKGRRTGLTFGIALDKSLIAASRRSAGGDNVFYVGDSKDKGLQFIGYCAKFLSTIAQAQGQAVSDIEEFLFEDQDKEGNTKHITSWRIRLASGFQIVALSSRPENLRGLQGHVVIDEAAFHPNVQSVLDAATALLIWGSKIVIISTHNGTKNAFNQLVKDVSAGVYGKSSGTYRATFDDAVANGLYERVCLIKGEDPTEEGKIEWYEDIRNSYGNRKAQMREELDAIPRNGNGVSMPTYWIEKASVEGRPVLRLSLDAEFTKKSVAERRSYVQDWINETLNPVLETLDEQCYWYFGQDYARHRDFSLITPLGIDKSLHRQIPFVIEMHKVPYKQQKQILFAMIDAMPRFVGGALDATGSGESLAEETADEYGHERIIQQKLSREWYGNYMPKTITLFEDERIQMPADSNLSQDLKAIEDVDGVPMVQSLRRKDLKDPDLTRHGDFAPALCLANQSYLVLDSGDYVVGSRPSSRDTGMVSGMLNLISGGYREIIRGYD